MSNESSTPSTTPSPRDDEIPPSETSETHPETSNREHDCQSVGVDVATSTTTTTQTTTTTHGSGSRRSDGTITDSSGDSDDSDDSDDVDETETEPESDNTPAATSFDYADYAAFEAEDDEVDEVEEVADWIHGDIPVKDTTTTSTQTFGRCGICHGIIRNHHQITLLVDCLHFFHAACLNGWIATGFDQNGDNHYRSCPICRVELLSEDLTTF